MSDISGRKWVRIQATPPDAECLARYKRRESTVKNPVFRKACDLAGISATPRQARRWMNGKGKAWRYMNEARAAVNGDKS